MRPDVTEMGGRWVNTSKKLKYFFLKKFYLFIFRHRGGEEERERNIGIWLLLTHPLLGTWPATQACAPTGNRTSDPLVHRPALNY